MKNIYDILDLSTAEIEELIALANDMMENPKKYSDACKNKILGTLFFEPSTRTRLSFESAMMTLGGNVLGFSDENSTSTSKGETLSDTVTVVSGYTDIIVMRHPKEGAPLVAMKNSLVPIINAGDGGHFHPTQTLTDLLTIHHELGRIDNLTIGLCGDLKFGRTVHSLIGAMSRYNNIKFVLISPDELKLPDYIKKQFIEDKNIEFVESKSLDEVIGTLDILYMTRIQRERFLEWDEYERLKDSYILTSQKMKLAKDNMIVLHPLPRVNEIAEEVDSDKRACYFKQTRYGRYIRMALIYKLLELANKTDKENRLDGSIKTEKVCRNPHCITGCYAGAERRSKVLENGEERCLYCDSLLY